MKFLFTFLSLLWAISINAQNESINTKVYTKSGGVYIGKVIQDDILSIKMVLETSDTIFIDKHNIINKKKRKKLKDAIVFENGKYHKKKGLFMSVDYASGSSSALAAVIIGLRVTPKWSLGISYSTHNNLATLPGFIQSRHRFNAIAAYGRYNITDNKMRFFAESSLGLGRAMNNWWRDEYSNGIYFRPAIGFEIANRKEIKWSFKISQYIQSTSGNQSIRNFNNGDLGDAEFSYKQIYNRTMIGIGVNF